LTLEDCQAAAKTVELADTTASVVNNTLDNGAPRPYGCYSKPSNMDAHPNYVLWFDLGGEKQINDPERLSLCKLGHTGPPTPAPTAPGDTAAPTAAPTAPHLTLEEEVADTQENRIHSLQHLLENRAEQHANAISPGAEKMVKNLMDCIIDHEDSKAIESIQIACQKLLIKLFRKKYTDAPTAAPTDMNGTYAPTDAPTGAPSDVPTTTPTEVPTATPTSAEEAAAEAEQEAEEKMAEEGTSNAEKSMAWAALQAAAEKGNAAVNADSGQ